jgi:outer membrane protein assembly factor BamB
MTDPASPISLANVALGLGLLLVMSSAAAIAPPTTESESQPESTHEDMLTDPDLPQGPSERCQLLGFAGLPGCEAWDENYRDESHIFAGTKTVLTADGDRLVSAATAWRQPTSSTIHWGEIAVQVQNTSTGEGEWQDSWIDPKYGWVEYVNDLALGPNDEHAYIAGGVSSDLDMVGYIVKLDLSAREPVWTLTLDETVLDVMPAENGDLAIRSAIYDGDFYAKLSLRSASDGVEQWSRDYEAASPMAPMVVGDRLVFSASTATGAELRSLDLADGSRDLTVSLRGPGEPIPVRMGISSEEDRAAILSLDRCSEENKWRLLVHAVDIDEGRLGWGEMIKGCADSFTGDAPVFAEDDETVMMATSVGNETMIRSPSEPEYTMEVFGLDADDGEQRWRIPILSQTNHRLAANDLVTASNDSRVYVTGTVFEAEVEERTPVHHYGPTDYLPFFPCHPGILVPDVPYGYLVEEPLDQATTCSETPTRGAFVQAIDAANGEAMNRLAHQDPWESRAYHIEAHPSNGEAYVGGDSQLPDGKDAIFTAGYEEEAFETGNMDTPREHPAR